MDLAEKKIHKALLKKSIKASKTGDVLDVVISRDKQTKTFIISDHSQKSLIKKLHTRCLVQIIGGILLATLGFGLLLSNIGNIDEFFDKL